MWAINIRCSAHTHIEETSMRPLARSFTALAPMPHRYARRVLGALALTTLIGAPAIDGRSALAAPRFRGSASFRGKSVTVKMVLNGQGMRFDPANITIDKGDIITFVNVSGGPHNVAFDGGKVGASAKAPLSAAMPNQIMALTGPLISAPNGTYKISFANVPAGQYPYWCTPHLAMGMKGVITVR
jgi:plastocyanin